MIGTHNHPRELGSSAQDNQPGPETGALDYPQEVVAIKCDATTSRGSWLSPAMQEYGGTSAWNGGFHVEADDDNQVVERVGTEQPFMPKQACLTRKPCSLAVVFWVRRIIRPGAELPHWLCRFRQEFSGNAVRSMENLNKIEGPGGRGAVSLVLVQDNSTLTHRAGNAASSESRAPTGHDEIVSEESQERCPLLLIFVSMYAALWGFFHPGMGTRSTTLIPSFRMTATLDGLLVINRIDV